MRRFRPIRNCFIIAIAVACCAVIYRTPQSPDYTTSWPSEFEPFLRSRADEFPWRSEVDNQWLGFTEDDQFVVLATEAVNTINVDFRSTKTGELKHTTKIPCDPELFHGIYLDHRRPQLLAVNWALPVPKIDDADLEEQYEPWEEATVQYFHSRTGQPIESSKVDDYLSQSALMQLDCVERAGGREFNVLRDANREQLISLNPKQSTQNGDFMLVPYACLLNQSEGRILVLWSPNVSESTEHNQPGPVPCELSIVDIESGKTIVKKPFAARHEVIGVSHWVGDHLYVECLMDSSYPPAAAVIKKMKRKFKGVGFPEDDEDEELFFSQLYAVDLNEEILSGVPVQHLYTSSWYRDHAEAGIEQERRFTFSPNRDWLEIRVSNYAPPRPPAWLVTIDKVLPIFGTDIYTWQGNHEWQQDEAWLADPLTGKCLWNKVGSCLSHNAEMSASLDLNNGQTTLSMYTTKPPLRWRWIGLLCILAIAMIRRFGMTKSATNSPVG